MIECVKYTCYGDIDKKKNLKKLVVIGIDTEADENGNCFMIATSTGDVFTPGEFPGFFFRREYRDRTFVAYNLKYDEGALIQQLEMDNIKELREKGETTYKGYTIKSIPGKCLTIQRNGHASHIYDMYNFYMGSLDYNAKKYLDESKVEMETKTFTQEYQSKHYIKIAYYCYRDAVLVKRLADLIIEKFNQYGVNVQKLYSTAYASYQYFREHTKYVTVKRLWDCNKQVLDYAMRSYNGGKFEVTEKGTGYYYEYDIVSAYPYEIYNLLDITHARVIYNKKYEKYATYGFLNCKMKININCNSPIAIKRKGVNIYPSGEITKVITKTEYEYLIKYQNDITIISAIWLFIDKKVYPYRKAIQNLFTLKDQFKKEGKQLDYHTVKIFMNSIYGKFVQLIKKDVYWKASACWNPVYGSIITSNTRVRISELQQKYDSVIAVHTDSVITTKKLPFGNTGTLGDLIYECEGKGLILGSGIYQIGNKIRFRGFNSKKDLFELCKSNKSSISLNNIRPYTWKEVAFHNWEKDKINTFTDVNLKLNINFDTKRIWLDDYNKFSDVLIKNVVSCPHYVTDNFIL